MKVQPPTTFGFEDPDFYEDLFDGDLPPEMAARMKNQKDWHDATLGLTTFAALLNHFRANGDRGDPNGVNRQSLIYELEAFQLILVRQLRRRTFFELMPSNKAPPLKQMSPNKITEHEPPLHVSGSGAQGHRSLDSLQVPGSGGGR